MSSNGHHRGKLGCGYVVQPLEVALWAFFTGSTFQKRDLLAVNPGDDADTNATIYVQIADTWCGVEPVPASRRNRLGLWELIDQFAAQLFEEGPQNCWK
jgi:ADP-ribosyl-[dinitrogen reductase] hydrolase